MAEQATQLENTKSDFSIAPNLPIEKVLEIIDRFNTHFSNTSTTVPYILYSDEVLNAKAGQRFTLEDREEINKKITRLPGQNPITNVGEDNVGIVYLQDLAEYIQSLLDSIFKDNSLYGDFIKFVDEQQKLANETSGHLISLKSRTKNYSLVPSSKSSLTKNCTDLFVILSSFSETLTEEEAQEPEAQEGQTDLTQGQEDVATSKVPGSAKGATETEESEGDDYLLKKRKAAPVQLTHTFRDQASWLQGLALYEFFYQYGIKQAPDILAEQILTEAFFVLNQLSEEEIRALIGNPSARLKLYRKLRQRLFRNPHFVVRVQSYYNYIVSQQNAVSDRVAPLVTDLNLVSASDTDLLKKTQAQSGHDLNQKLNDLLSARDKAKAAIKGLFADPQIADQIQEKIDQLIFNQVSPNYLYLLNSKKLGLLFNIDLSDLDEDQLLQIKELIAEATIHRIGQIERDENVEISQHLNPLTKAEAQRYYEDPQLPCDTLIGKVDTQLQKSEELLSSSKVKPHQPTYHTLVVALAKPSDAIESEVRDTQTVTSDQGSELWERKQEAIKVQTIHAVLEEIVAAETGLVAAQNQALISLSRPAAIEYLLMADQLASDQESQVITPSATTQETSSSTLPPAQTILEGDASAEARAVLSRRQQVNWARRKSGIARRAGRLTKSFAQTANRARRIAMMIGQALQALWALITSIISPMLMALGSAIAGGVTAGLLALGVSVGTALFIGVVIGVVSAVAIIGGLILWGIQSVGSLLGGGASQTAAAEKTGSGIRSATPSASFFTPEKLTIVGSGTVMAAAVIFTPHPAFLHTLGENFQESPYVTIEKSAITGSRFENGSFPGSIEYQVVIKADKGFNITVRSIADIATITHKDSSDRQSIPLGEGALPTEYPLLIPSGQEKKFTYIQNYDPNLVDTSISNTFKINFDAISASGAEKSVQGKPAQTAAVICIGECPQLGEKCWPTSGYISQRPFGGVSHQTADSYDIATPIGTNVYSPFNGRARSDYESDGLGNYVIVEGTDQAGDIRYYYFGHLSGSGLTTTWQDITQGELIGISGNTGHSTGPHLHYEMANLAGRINISNLTYDSSLTQGIRGMVPEPNIAINDPIGFTCGN